MKTRIANRVGRIISGSMHALIDAIEGATPEIIMEQAIREIESAMDEVRLELGKNAAAKHLASRRLLQKNTEHEELAEKAQTALSEGREDLAEAGVGRQLDIEAQMPILEETIAECSENEKELEGYLVALKAKKREMEEELIAFRKTKELSAIHGDGVVEGATHSSSIDRKVSEATSAFDRVLSRHTNQRLKDTEVSGNTAQLDELEDLSRNNRIKERLALMKAGEPILK